VFTGELEPDSVFNMKLLKSISGGDVGKMRGFMQSQRDIYYQATVLGMGNFIPKFAMTVSKDPEIAKQEIQAAKDRLIIIPFNNRFDVDDTIEKKVLEMSDYFFTYILNKGIVQASFPASSLPQLMRIAIDENAEGHISVVDSLQEFLSENFEISTSVIDEIREDEFIQQYQTYCSLRSIDNPNYKRDCWSDHKVITKSLKISHKIERNRCRKRGVNYERYYYQGLKQKTSIDCFLDDDEPEMPVVKKAKTIINLDENCDYPIYEDEE
jgi:phage/plasmid-associated DNA primase